MDLETFNQAEPDRAARFLAPCVPIESWQRRLIAGRPYASRQELLEAARQTASTLLIPRSAVLPRLIGVTSAFGRFVELDRPAYCAATLSAVAADQAAVHCVISQEGRAAAELELAFLGDWQAL